MAEAAVRPKITPNWIGGLLNRASNPEDGVLGREPPQPSTLDVAVSEAQRSIAAAIEEAQERHAAEIQQHLSDQRDAAILNTLLTAMAHAGTENFTAEIIARWRRMRADTEATASGAVGETVPAGFGPVVRTHHGQRLAALMTRQATALAGDIAKREAEAAHAAAAATPIARDQAATVKVEQSDEESPR